MQDCYDVTIAALNGQIKSLREVQEKYPDQDVRFAISDFSNDYRLWFAPVRSMMSLRYRTSNTNCAERRRFGMD